MAQARMKKAEMFHRVAEQVKGKGLSKDDVRFTYNDEIESASRSNEISPAQRQNWYPTETELKKLVKLTKSCQC